MKRLITTCLVCVLLTAAASQGMVISFDENGNGSWTNDQGQSGTLEHGIGICPVGPNWETLYYELPKTVVEGDQVFYENPPTSSEIDSDILRFVNVGSTAPTGRVYVYSDIEKGDQSPLDLADTGIPTDNLPNVWGAYEQGTEDGWNGVVFTAYSSNESGYMGGETVTYHFTSDVPEPATMALLGLGSLVLLRNRKA